MPGDFAWAPDFDMYVFVRGETGARGMELTEMFSAGIRRFQNLQVTGNLMECNEVGMMEGSL